MNLYDKGDPEEITKLGNYLERLWTSQRKLDDQMLDLALMTNTVEVQKDTGSPRPTTKRYRTGLGRSLPDRRIALLTGKPQQAVLNPDPENERLRKHLDEKLEPWLREAWERSQQSGEVWERQKQDLVILGRSWDSVLPHPSIWATERFQSAADAYATAKNEEDSRDAETKLRMLKSRYWPIRWVYVPAATTWSTFEPECWLPEVLELRMMTGKEITQRWGDKAIPERLRKSDDSSATYKVYIWANHQWCACVIPDNETPSIFGAYEHGFGRSPYDCCEARLAGTNSDNIRWLGMMFGARYTVESLDEQISDIRELTRDEARTPRIIYIDPEQRTNDADPLVAARNKNTPTKITDGMVLLTGEKIELAPTSQLNPAVNDFLNRMTNLIEMIEISKAQTGEALSGQSQNTLNTSYQIANKQLDIFMEALAKHGESVNDRHMLSVMTIGEEVPIFSDKNMLAVGPDDVEAWIGATKCQMLPAIPLDQSIIAQVASQWINQLGIDPETTWETVLGLQNPDQISRKAKLARRRAAIEEQVVIPKSIERLTVPNQPLSPQEIAELQALMGTSSSDLQEFLGGPSFGGQPAQMPGNPMPSAQANGAFGNGGIPGNVLQGMANIGRAGPAPQMPGNPSGG